MSKHTGRDTSTGTSGTKTTKRALSGIGALCLAGGTGALTMGAIAPAHAAGAAPLKYSCTATVFGTDLDQGTWTALVSTDAPASVKVGATLPKPNITAAVTTSAAAADTLRTLGVASVDGTSAAGYTMTGDVAKPGSRTGNLTIPTTKVPASGSLTTTAKGSGQAETAGSSAGTIKVTVGDFSAQIQTYDATGKASLLLPVACTLQSGQDAVINTIQVEAPATTPPPTSTSTTTSTPPPTSTSTTTTSTPPPTSTSTTTTSTPPPTSTSTTTTSTPPPTSTGTSTPPPTSAPTPSTVQTGSVAPDGGPNGLMLAGVGLGGAGLIALGGAAMMRRREQD